MPYFPYKFHTDLIDILSENKELFNIITYDDLCWDYNEPYFDRYTKELADWRKKVERNNQIHILIQHDVDNFPKRTMKLVKYERDKNIKTNIMIFNIKSKGIVEDKTYKLDHKLLSECEHEGFVIGYHCNAFERANYDLDLAQKFFEEDVYNLKKKFNINHFSCHGGQWNIAKTLNNKDIIVPKILQKKLNWVHNGQTPYFDKTFSDGGLTSYKHLNQDLRDIRIFLSSMKIGGRYRILTHPQYYSDPYKIGSLLSTSAWYVPMLNLYDKGEEEKFWLKTRLYFLNVFKSTKKINAIKIKLFNIKNQIKKKISNLFKIPKKKSTNKSIKIHSFDKYQMSENEKPIFVKGMSRSGGTLLTTLIDCHPQISMSYELYPKLLDTNLTKKDYLYLAKQIMNSTTRRNALNIYTNKNFLKILIARAERGGLQYKEVGKLLYITVSQFINNETISERNCFEIMSALCKQKMISENKKLWGMKCDQNYENYLKLWPKARFINIVRDGRDVLSSQLNTGSFNPDAKLLAKSWVKTHMNFKKLVLKNKNQFLQIRYEDLINDPYYELKKITLFLELTFSNKMVTHYKNSLTIFKSNHISMNQLTLPINKTQIGRWKKDLPNNEIDTFLSEAGETLLEFGYKIN